MNYEFVLAWEWGSGLCTQSLVPRPFFITHPVYVPRPPPLFQNEATKSYIRHLFLYT